MERVLYLHGFASGPRSRKALFFYDRFQELGIDLEIPDLAAGNFERLTVTGQLEVMENAMRGQPAALIGSSLGGYLAALYASRHPEVVKLVLMAPAFSFSKRWPELLGQREVAAWKSSGWLSIFHYNEGMMRRLGYQIVEDSRLYPDFPSFSQPALILHGTRDTIVPLALSEQFASTHQNATLQRFDSDHELLDVLEPMWLAAKPFLGTSEPHRREVCSA